MTATTEQFVFEAAKELTRAYDGLRLAVRLGEATRAHRDRVHTAECAWNKARNGRLEAGKAAA